MANSCVGKSTEASTGNPALSLTGGEVVWYRSESLRREQNGLFVMVKFPNRLLSGICQPRIFSRKIVSQLCSRQKLRLLGSSPAFDSLHHFSSKDTEGTAPGLTRLQHAPALLQQTPAGFNHTTEKLLLNFPWQKWRYRRKRPPTSEQSLGGSWYSAVTATQETCIKQGINSIPGKKRRGGEHIVIHYTCL